MTSSVSVLFDLDGTLLDTVPDLALALNLLLQRHGKATLPVEQIRPQVSNGARGMLSLAFPHHVVYAEQSPLVQEFLTIYEELLGQDTTLFPGIPELITYLNQQHIPLAIVTNKAQRFAEPLVQQFPLLAAIPVLVCGDTLPVFKPSPKPLLHAIQFMSPSTATYWYIGDADKDIEAGKAANMQTAVASWGYIPSTQEAKQWQANQFLKQPNDLLMHL